jgi:hypothetical protein
MSDVNGHCSGVFKEAWHKVKGMKHHFWGGVMLFTLIGLGGFSLLSLILVFGQMVYFPSLVHLMQVNPMIVMTLKYTALPLGLLVCFLLYHIGQTLLEVFLLLPMRMGVRLIALRRIADKSIHALYVFKYLKWHYIWRFAVLEVLVVLAIGIPAGIGLSLFCLPTTLHFAMGLKVLSYVVGVLFVAFALYLFVSYFFVSFAIIDRNISPWGAMELSRKAISKRWFCIFGTLIALLVIIVISAIPLFIGLFWTIPFSQNVIAILYRNMIGIEGNDPVSLCQAECKKSV